MGHLLLAHGDDLDLDDVTMVRLSASALTKSWCSPINSDRPETGKAAGR